MDRDWQENGQRVIGNNDKKVSNNVVLILYVCPGAFEKKDLEKLKSTKECVKFDLQKANLSEANLRGANLEEVNLSRADLIDADLSSANLTGADLRRADTFDSDLTETNLKGAKLSVGDLGAFAFHTIMPDGKENNSGCEN